MDICKFTVREFDGLRLDERGDGLSQRACDEEACNAEQAAENGGNCA
jgi:hypothetical protein